MNRIAQCHYMLQHYIYTRYIVIFYYILKTNSDCTQTTIRPLLRHLSNRCEQQFASKCTKMNSITLILYEHWITRLYLHRLINNFLCISFHLKCESPMADAFHDGLQAMVLFRELFIIKLTVQQSSSRRGMVKNLCMLTPFSNKSWTKSTLSIVRASIMVCSSAPGC